MVKYYKFGRRSYKGTGWIKVKTRKNSMFCWFCAIYSPAPNPEENKLNVYTKWSRESIESQLKQLKAEEIPKEEFIKAAIQYGR